MTAAVPPIGTLTERVQLQRRVTTDEAAGGTMALFTPIATVWARVTELAARPDFSSDARGQSISHIVVLRFRTDLMPGDRIVYRGGALELAGAADLNGRRAYLSCQCTRTVVTG